MKIKLPVLVALLLSAISVSVLAQATDAEQSAVRVPLEIYLRAHATGDSSHLGKSFHPDAKIKGINFRDGKLVSWKFEDYVKSFSCKPAADEPQRRRRIVNVEITKNAAIAKLVFEYPAVTITDYMLLLKIDGEWKIVNKIAQGQPTQPSRKS